MDRLEGIDFACGNIRHHDGRTQSTSNRTDDPGSIRAARRHSRGDTWQRVDAKLRRPGSGEIPLMVYRIFAADLAKGEQGRERHNLFGRRMIGCCGAASRLRARIGLSERISPGVLCLQDVDLLCL